MEKTLVYLHKIALRPFFFFCYKILAQGTNIHTEPKHIVFLTHLLLLFGFCHSCKAGNPQVDAHEVGTQVVVTTTCSNPKCPNQKAPGKANRFCQDQSYQLVIFSSAGSASKVFRILSLMGPDCLSMNTFLRYQRVSILHTNNSTV